MTAEQSLRDGKPAEALALLQEEVRRDPANPKLRTFLFQLLCVLGQWPRALRQLEVVGEMDASTLAMVSAYREAVRCEALRQEVMAGRKSPLLFGQPEEWMALMAQALRHDGAGEIAQGATLRSQALELAAAVPGTLTTAAEQTEQFAWIADADSRLGPTLEAILNGSYYWLPLQNLRSVAFEPPEDLRDMVWTPAQLTFANGGQTVAMVPTRYPGSETSDDGAIQLARRTEWRQLGEETFYGSGQRLFATDTGDHALLELRRIDLGTTAAES